VDGGGDDRASEDEDCQDGGETSNSQEGVQGSHDDTHVFYAARSADKTAAAIAAFLRAYTYPVDKLPELGRASASCLRDCSALQKWVRSINPCDHCVSLAKPNGVALASSQQSLRQWRNVGQCPARGIGLIRADDPERLVAPILALDRDR
jgi:hypothetical protein